MWHRSSSSYSIFHFDNDRGCPGLACKSCGDVPMMSSFLSRVAQVRGSCHCPQCSSAVNGVSRRAAASATRRMPKHATSATLWYSGIFAAAATFDAGVKMRRREQWELAIADVRQELEQPVNVVGKPLSEERQEEQSYLGARTERYRPFAELLDEHPIPTTGMLKPRLPTNTGVPVTEHRLPPCSVYARQERRQAAETRRWSPKKLARVQTSVEMLQFKLFLELHKRGWSEEAAIGLAPHFSETILQDRDTLRRQLKARHDSFVKIGKADDHLKDYTPLQGGVGLCNYSQHGTDVERLGEVRALNARLGRLFHAQTTGHVSSPALLSTLAYELGASPVPPNLDTFNTILLGFSKVNMPDLTDKVISTLRQAHMRPNEISLALILQHYTDTNQSERFVHWVELMSGKHNGLALARPGIRVNDTARTRLVRKPDEPWKVIQLPYPTPGVFGAVIAGTLKFAGFDTALSICSKMGGEGWGLCMSGMIPLLRDCAARGDWTSGLGVWKHIEELNRTSRKKEKGRWVSERIELSAFGAMLKLCLTCKQQARYDAIWEVATTAHRHSATKLAQFIESLTIGSLPDNVRQNVQPFATINRDSLKEDIGVFIDSSTDACFAPPPTADINHRLVLDAGVQDDVPINASSSESQTGSVESSDAANDAERNVGVAHESVKLEYALSPRSEPRHSRTPPSSRLRNTPKVSQAPQLLLEQLHGTLPFGDELDQYELAERPMSVCG